LEDVRFDKVSFARKPKFTVGDHDSPDNSTNQQDAAGHYYKCPNEKGFWPGSEIGLSCPGSKKGPFVIPELYVRDYDKYPPVVVNAIGFTNHGKTVFFSSLLSALRNLCLGSPHLWPDFYTLSVDDRCLREIGEIEGRIGLLNAGKQPETIPKVWAIPTMLRLCGLPLPLRNCTLLIYDINGEIFRSGEESREFAGYVKKASTLLFLINIPRLREQNKGLNHLLAAYFIGLANMNAIATPTHQNVIIVYTAADEMGTQLKEFPKLHNYIRADTFEGIQNVQKYLKRLKEISNDLQAFTIDPRGLGEPRFAATAIRKFRKVEFCLISSLGMPPERNRLRFHFAPRRILDPLLLIVADNQLSSIRRLRERIRGLLHRPWNKLRYSVKSGVLV
jgi:hypothetical protein